MTSQKKLKGAALMDTNEIIDIVDELWALEGDTEKIDRMIDEITRYFEHTEPDEENFKNIREGYKRIRDFLEIAEIYIISGQTKIQNISKRLDSVIAQRRSSTHDSTAKD